MNVTNVLIGAAGFVAGAVCASEWYYRRYIHPDCGLSEAEMDAQRETLREYLARKKGELGGGQRSEVREQRIAVKNPGRWV